MDNIEKNVAIAEMCGAKKENWYPPNLDTGGSGTYLVMPHKRFFPNLKRSCGDYALKYDTSMDWQYKIMGYLRRADYGVQISWDHVIIVDLKHENDTIVYEFIENDPKGSVFEALYQFALYVKENSIQLFTD